MSKTQDSNNSSRRRFLKLSATGAIVAVIAGVGAYWALQPQPAAPAVTPTPATTPSPRVPPAPATPVTPSPIPAPAVTPIPTPSPVASPKPSPTPTLVDKANEEGAVMLYSTYDKDTVDVLTNGFMKKYPKIKVESIIGYTELRERALMEGRAGRHINDLWLSSPIYMQPLDEAGFVGQYVSPEEAIWPRELKSPDGKWTGFSYPPQVMATYNTQRVKREELPKNYWDLLQPRWKNVMGYWEMNGQPHVLVIMRRKIIGEGRWREWVSKFLDQNPRPYGPGYGAHMTALKIGEVDLTVWSYTGTTTTLMQQGAPLEYVRTPGTIMGYPGMVWINKYAPHPNGARLMKDYMLSYEGQSLINDMGKYPMMRPGLPPKMGLGIGTGEPVRAEDIISAWPFTLEEQNAELEYWKQIEREKGLR